MVFLRIPHSFPTTCQLITIEIFIILFLFAEVYCCHHVSTIPYFVTFQTIPYLSHDRSIINFKLRKTPSNDMFFSIIGYGARTENKLNDFCQNNKCSIPLFIGGHIVFSIKNSNRELYHQVFDLPRLNFTCTTPNWENRMCYAKNICYNSGIFALTSPFPIIFDRNLLTLGARTPPVDFTFSRLSDRFKYQFSLPQGIPYLRNKANLLSIFHHLEQEWHLYYDLLIPTFWTLTKDGYDNFKDRHLLFLNFCEKVPHVITSLTNHRLLCLDRSFCFEDLEFGMVKVTNSTKNELDPPYDFPNISLKLFKKEIYKFFNISKSDSNSMESSSYKISNITKKTISEPIENNNESKLAIEESNSKKSKILIIARFLTRKIININDLSSAMASIFPDAEVICRGFEGLSMKDQILLVRNVDILIGMHGSALSNIIWMKKNSTLIEIFPYKFTCRDWYEKACELAKVNYISYHPQSEKEASVKNPDEKLAKCYQGKYPCKSTHCLDILRDQDVIIDINNFVKKIKLELSHMNLQKL